MRQRLALVVFVALFAACTPEPTPAPTPDIQATVDAAVQQAITSASPPTEAEPTATKAPTPTVLSTPTPTPTPTPIPTPTPTPIPTPTPTVPLITKATATPSAPKVTVSVMQFPAEGGRINVYSFRTQESNVSSYGLGDLISVEAFPEKGYSFFAWGGLETDDATVNPITLAVTGSLNISAFFRADEAAPVATAGPPLGGQSNLVDTIAKVRPSVVRIQIVLASGGQGSGSGFIYRVDSFGQALILTNFHVIEDAKLIRVTVNDADEYDAKFMGGHSGDDLAVLSICCSPSFQFLPFGTSQVPAGTAVLAMGYPLGAAGEASATRGIISKGVYFDPDQQRWELQTDAPINPGNSGGPLLTESGEVLGINTEKTEYSKGGRPVEGMGYAVSEYTILERLGSLSLEPTGTVIPAPQPTPTPYPTATPLPRATATPALSASDERVSRRPLTWVSEDVVADVGMVGQLGWANAWFSFDMEAVFLNPNTISSNTQWNYGFFFHLDDRKKDVIVVTSDGEWYHKTYDSYLAEFGLGWAAVDQGIFGISMLDRLDGSANALKLRVWDGFGEFYLNGTKIADILLTDYSGSSPRGSGLGVTVCIFSGQCYKPATVTVKTFSASPR